MNNRNLFVLTLLVLSVASFAIGQDCKDLTVSSPPEELVSLLRTGRGLPQEQQDPGCITFAIRHLENKPSPEAVNVLIEYLDFARPLSDAERTGFMIHGPLDLSSRYPATGVLMTLGKEAILPLLSTIKDSNSSTVRQNAAYTLLLIYREQPDKGILLLKQEARKQPESETLQISRLNEAAQRAVQWCGKRKVGACQAAATNQTPE